MTATGSRWMLKLGFICVAAACPLLASACDSSGDGQAEDGGAASDSPEKLVFLFQKQRNPEQTRANADAAAAFLSERLGIEVEAVVPGSYAASVQALVSGQADVAYVSSLPFLLARRDADARLLVAEVREDPTGVERTNYDSVWVVRADSDLMDMSDVAERASDLTLCFTSATSTSGFVMASLRLVRERILEPGQDAAEVFDSVAYGGGYSGALNEVLAGRADLCAVSYYTVEGPNSDLYVTPERRDELRIIARTPEVPTHLICVRGGVSAELSERITAALLALSDERADLLESVYGAAELREVDEDEHVAAAVEAMRAIEMPIDGLVK